MVRARRTNERKKKQVFKSITIDDVVSKSAQATQPQRKSSHKYQRPSINQHSMLSNKSTLKLQIEEGTTIKNLTPTMNQR